MNKFENKTLIKNKLKVLIVDDHTVVRYGLGIILEKAYNEIDISHAENLPDMNHKLNENHDLIFLDINFPGGYYTKMVEEIRLKHPATLIMMFSISDEIQHAPRYFQAGANGYLNKTSNEIEILKAVQTLLKTGKYISKVVSEKIVENTLYNQPLNPLDKLSKREMEVLELLANGDGNLEISNKLNIQMTTVSTFKSRIFEKLGIKNMVKLIEVLKIYKN